MAVAADPGIVIERLAAEYRVTPRDVVEVLPAAMRQFVLPDAFLPIMKEVAQWGGRYADRAHRRRDIRVDRSNSFR
jgi:putative heme iron utilization protein